MLFSSTAAAAPWRPIRRPRTRSRDAFKAAGLDVEIELIAGGDCAVRCRRSSERGDELLVVGGGDGTISAAASALVGTKTVLGILPLGTLNHFARDLGIPTDLEEAAKLIAGAASGGSTSPR